MDILANFSIKLSQEQLTQLITKEAERAAGRKVKKVHWNIRGYTPGDRPGDAGTEASASVTVDLGEEIVRPGGGASQWENR